MTGHRRRLERLEAQSAEQATTLPRPRWDAVYAGDLDAEFLPGVSISSLCERSAIDDVLDRLEAASL